MKRLAILGGGGHGRVAAEIAELTGYEAICFLDPRGAAASTPGPWKIVGGDDDETITAMVADTAFFVGIGDNAIRQRLTLRLEKLGAVIATLTHPAATVSPYASIGTGTLVCAGAVINPFAAIGRGAIVNTAASVDHDCTVGDFAHVAPGARCAAAVMVGETAFLGVGCSVRPGIRIGRGATIGAGAAVVADIADGITAVGVPARPV